MRFLVDTNVVVSAVIWGGLPFRLLQAATEGDVELYASPALLAELRAVLGREHLASRLSGQQVSVDEAVRFYGDLAISVSPLAVPRAVPRDADDDQVIAAAVAAYPERIFGGFFVNPTQPDTEARVRRALDELKLRVVCLFPAMFHFSLAESEGARAAVALVSERPGTAVFVHCGALSVGARTKLGLPSRFDMRYSNPLDVYKLAAEFPQTPFIIPHFGGGLLREALLLADLCPNVYLDTSSSNKWMQYEGLDLATVFKRALAVVGPERLLFGSDSSFFPRGWVSEVFYTQINALLEAGVSEEQAQAILGGNLRRLFQAG